MLIVARTLQCYRCYLVHCYHTLKLETAEKCIRDTPKQVVSGSPKARFAVVLCRGTLVVDLYFII